MRCFALALVLCSVPSNAAAQRIGDVGRSMFVDAGPVAVLVETVTEEAELRGINADQLRTLTRLRLRSHGIEVMDSSLESPQHAYIHVSPTLLHLESFQSFVYSIEISFHRKIPGAAHPFETSLIIATLGSLGTAPEETVKAQVNASLLAMVDEMADAYLSAND